VPLSQLTVTFADRIVPEPFATVQVCGGALGSPLTVSAWLAPGAMPVENVTGPSAATAYASPPSRSLTTALTR
jgi:hypothetical protein